MNNSSTGNSPDNNSKKNRFTLRRILRTISCLIAAAGLLMITRSIVNAAFLSNYEQENYSRFPEITLLPFRFGENYIVPFNMGNIEYQQGNYDEAASYYQQALAAKPPERDEECIIRVNLALSMCHKINFETLDRTDNKALEAAITQLQSARNVLTEHGCASEPVGSDDGHYENADKLKHDIDKMLEELQKQLDENKSNQDDQQSGGQGGGQNDQQNGGQGGGQNDQKNDGQSGGQNDQQNSGQGGTQNDQQDKQDSNQTPPGNLPGDGGMSGGPDGGQSGGGNGDNSGQGKNGGGNGDNSGQGKTGGGS